jgi:hypothetical protein
MKLPLSYRAGTLVLGATFMLAACGGSDGVIVMGSLPPAPTPLPAASTPATTMNSTTSKDVAAQALFASDGLTGRASNANTVVAGMTNDVTGVVDTSLKQMDRAMRLGVVSRAIGVNNVLTINCAQGGTATLNIRTANSRQFSTGDVVSIAASNCVDGTQTANGTITVTFTNVTGTPSSTSAWSATMTMAFDNVTVNDETVARAANGNLNLVYNQTAFRNASFSLTTDSLQVQRTRAGVTTNRTLTGFNTSGSVNGDTFTYRTAFTLEGNFPRLGQGSYNVTTTQDFVQQSGNNPSQGTLRVAASDGSVVTLTAVDSTSVNVATDSNGDGTAEETVTTTWGELGTLV